MHHHLEIVMPPTDDVNAALSQIMAPFDEDQEFGDESEYSRGHAFWDYWLIGGRWSASKLLAAFSEDRLKAFHELLSEQKVTVAGLQAGKPTLSPASQQGAVDQLWRESFPESRLAQCPLFDHYKGDVCDVMRLGDISALIKCDHVMIAGLDYKDEKLQTQFMVRDSIWNGVIHQKTTWCGTLNGAVVDYKDRLDNRYRPELAEKRRPMPDWLCVTVDYHS